MTLTMNDLYLALWAATIPLMPYTLYRQKYDWFYGLLFLFWGTSIHIFTRMHTLGEYCRCPKKVGTIRSLSLSRMVPEDHEILTDLAFRAA